MEHVMADQAFNLDGAGNIDPNDKCIPRFFYQPKHMVAESLKQGHPVFDQEVMVEIIIPGAKSPMTRKMIDADKERWPIQWFKFQKMGESKIEGMPIDQWPALTVPQVAMLKSLNIVSVEMLAGLDEAHLVKIGPDGRSLKARAELYLKAAKDSALFEKMSKRIDELEAEIKELKSKPTLSEGITGTISYIVSADGKKTWSGKGRKPNWVKEMQK